MGLDIGLKPSQDKDYGFRKINSFFFQGMYSFFPNIDIQVKLFYFLFEAFTYEMLISMLVWFESLPQNNIVLNTNPCGSNNSGNWDDTLSFTVTRCC